MMNFISRRYYSFNQFLRERFKCRVWKLSLDANFSCPNRDGTLSKEGCIFCNNEAFSYFTGKGLSLREQIIHSIEYAQKRFKAEKFIAYFQSFTNTYGEVDRLKEKYDTIREFPQIVGLAISTRPDCIDKEKIELIQSYTQDYLVWIEYGLQSIYDKHLEFLNRGHSFQDFLKALELTRARGIFIGAHLILGLPNQTRDEVVNTAKVLSRLPLNGIKFHCLHVVKNTLLERLYNQGMIRLFSEQEYVESVCDFLEFIPREWVILRLVSEASADYLIAPSWLNQKQIVLKKIEEELERRNSWQGKKYFKEDESPYSASRGSQTLC